MRLGRIERYVLSGLMSSVAAALAVIGSVVLLIEFVDISRNVGGRAEVGFAQLLWLTLLKAPATILLLLPSASCSARWRPTSASTAAAS